MTRSRVNETPHGSGRFGTETGFGVGPLAAHVRVVTDVTLVDFRRRAVFRRRVNPNRGDAVLVEAVRPGRARRVELGVAVREGGRVVWIPNPDADPDLFASFRECLAAARQTPVSWALDGPAVVGAQRPRLAPVPS